MRFVVFALATSYIWSDSWKRMWNKISPSLTNPGHTPETVSKRPPIPLTTISPPEKRRMFIGFMLAFPLFFFVVCELTLRAIGFGPNLDLFVSREIAGATYYTINHDIKGRYFSRIDFSPNTSPDFFRAQKPPGTFRIFCLGGSTTVGYPYGFVGSFSTFLRDRLKAVFPDIQFEIVNLGMTATNSYTALDIARELPDYEPDLIIVYDGHNEFYGALGIASRENIGSSRWITLAYLKLIHLKTFYLLKELLQAALGVVAPSAVEDVGGTLMERLAREQFVPRGSETYLNALEIFRSNLEEMCSTLSSKNIPLILTTQVSNLRHLKPFISKPGNELSQSQTQELHASINAGLTHWMNGHSDSALNKFDHAFRLDSTFAEVRYLRARCLDTMGNTATALHEYIRARDFDQLRFRMSSDFNRVLTSFEHGRNIQIVDMEKVIAGASPDGIIGRELILEHLHPTARGYFLMAKEYARVMSANGMPLPEKDWSTRDTVSDDALWHSRPLTALDELCGHRRTQILTSGWPFTLHSTKQSRIDEQDTLSRIAASMVRGDLTWEEGHVSAAEYYKGRGEFGKAAKEFGALINQIPINVSAYLLLAQTYVKDGKIPEARATLQRSLTIEQTSFAYRLLGGIDLEEGNTSAAIENLSKAYPLADSPDDKTEIGYLTSVAYFRSHMYDEARASLERTLAVSPSFGPARRLLEKLPPPR